LNNRDDRAAAGFKPLLKIIVSRSSFKIIVISGRAGVPSSGVKNPSSTVD